MPADRGLTPTGFLTLPQTTIRNEMTASIQAIRGPSFDMTDGSLCGQWAGVLSEREAALWDLGQAIDSSQDPDKATDGAQDALCALTGTFRASARASTVVESLNGVPGTVVRQGTIIATSSTGDQFATAAPATIGSLGPWSTGTIYNVGQRQTNVGYVYQALVTGTSGSGAGPTSTVVGVPFQEAGFPLSPVWVCLGLGTGSVDTAVLSVELDAIAGNAYDISAIRTPVGGLQSATNILAASIGAPQQSNESLRVTRENELTAQGTGPADAIRAAVLKVAGVTSCTVFQNLTDVVDANGQQPHSVQVIVEGGDDTAIATVIKGQVAAGIPTVGTTTVNITDSMGTAQPIKFTRVTQVPIYVDASYTYNPAPTSKGGYSTTSGAALAQAAIAAFGNSLSIGRDVVASSLSAAIFPLFVGGVQLAGVQGVLDVTSVKISTAPSPTVNTTISITPFQRATFSAANITIHATPGTV